MFRRILTAAAVMGTLGLGYAQAQVTQSGPTVSYSVAPQAAPAKLDYAHAIAMPLPQASTAPGFASSAAPLPQGKPGFATGSVGTGQTSLVTLAPALSEAAIASSTDGAAPAEFGTSGQPYTTSRVNGYTAPTTNYYPFRAAGKLFFNIGSSTYVCSASLIKPGVIVTAAHCVANYGHSQFYSNWQFVPAYQNGMAPYGVWVGTGARVLTSYYNGTDGCYQYGVICPNDVAVISLVSQNNTLPGSATGTFNYGWNGYSYNGSGQALITQLGYPVALDQGVFMERTDSQGFKNTTFSNNTVIGSLQTGGSSGGPWVVNLGRDPILNGFNFGTYPVHNVIVGVTSWGYTSADGPKQQGAAPFTDGNIVVLVKAQCDANPNKC